MEKKIHLRTAKVYFAVAEEKNEEYEQEKEEDKQIALRIVAAQNYFYCAVNLIEAILADKEEHSFSHDNRMSKMREYSNSFTKDVFELYDLVDRSQRNKVTYRGENGPKYENIKRLARLLVKENEQQV
ncbi:MAG: hypothetical protein ABIA37_04195 [Candidatus Woesearchaeota archaeon]